MCGYHRVEGGDILCRFVSETLALQCSTKIQLFKEHDLIETRECPKSAVCRE